MSQIETTRRAMYSLLAELKPLQAPEGFFSFLPEFESAMEEHLEALRKEIDGLKGDVRTAEAAHEQGREVSRVLKAQVDELLSENDQLHKSGAKYREFIRSAERQNKAERQNVEAFLETQDELVSQIVRLQRELAFRKDQERTGVHVSGGFGGEPPKVKACTFDPSQNAAQEVK